MKSELRLTPDEELLLMSAREDGLIPFPEGRAWEVEAQMRLLLAMESKGYLHRKRNGHVHGFYLTPAGLRLVSALQRRTRQSPARQPHRTGDMARAA